MEKLKELTPYELFGTFTHVGVAVRDLPSYCEKLKALFGYETESFGETPEDPTRRYYGEFEDFKAKMAFFYLENTMLELLCPYQGRNVWQDFLDERGEGLHHLNFDVVRYDEAIAHLEGLGLKVVQSGSQSRRPGFRWCYVDARKEIGMYLEIAEVPEQ